MIRIPILKIILATFALLFTHSKKIVEVSVFPAVISIPFVLSFMEILPNIKNLEDMQTLQLGMDFLLYTLLFLYAVLSLNISLFRLTSLGEQSTHALGIVPPRLVLKLLPYYLFVQLVIVSVSLLQIPLLEPIVFMLLAHILLKFISIVTNLSGEGTLRFVDRLNIAIIQFIVPIVFLMIATILNIGSLIIVVKILALYYGAISLGLIFNNLYSHS